jgi:hypothetical protein
MRLTATTAELGRQSGQTWNVGEPVWRDKKITSVDAESLRNRRECGVGRRSFYPRIPNRAEGGSVAHNQSLDSVFDFCRHGRLLLLGLA